MAPTRRLHGTGPNQRTGACAISTTSPTAAGNHVTLTAGRVQDFVCPPGKSQAFLWDTKVPGLGLRVTNTGAKAYIVERKFGGKSLRMTIGQAGNMPLEAGSDYRGESRAFEQRAARPEARRVLSLIDAGKDPRHERDRQKAEESAERDRAKAERLRQELTGLEAWETYRSARAERWGELSRRDHRVAAQPGGQPRKRARVKTTQPGPLYGLLNRPLAQLDEPTVTQWVKAESKRRPTVTAKSFRMLRAFINWCGEQDDLKLIARLDSCAARKTREALPRSRAKSDVLEMTQLPAWFAAVRAQPNAVISAYLQALLLTGARRDELLRVQWTDVDFKTRCIDLKDKVDGRRTIPLAPYVAQLLNALPRRARNPWVFSSPTAKSGRLQEPRLVHNKALAVAGLPHLTLHGLRRSFGSLSEWSDFLPRGVVAQIQGHKPSATVEKHYRPRYLDLLRFWYEKLEVWMLEQAGIEFEGSDTTPRLRVVNAA